MRLRCAFWVAAVVTLGTSVTPAAAQNAQRVDITLPSSATGVTVAARNVLDSSFVELMRNGFPTRLSFRTEMWTTGRWFNDIVDRVEWDVIVSYDLIDRTFRVARWTRQGVLPLGTYSRFADARAASEIPYLPQLRLPAQGRRGYITVQVDVQTLDISDLAEMQRWLEGEARPAVQGKRNPGTALTRGLRTLVARLLGGEVRHLEARSSVIQF